MSNPYLLRFPPEIRIEIYNLVIKQPDDVVFGLHRSQLDEVHRSQLDEVVNFRQLGLAPCGNGAKLPPHAMALCQTCRQIRNETLHLFFSKNTLRMYPRKPEKIKKQELESRPRAKAQKQLPANVYPFFQPMKLFSAAIAALRPEDKVVLSVRICMHTRKIFGKHLREAMPLVLRGLMEFHANAGGALQIVMEVNVSAFVDLMALPKPLVIAPLEPDLISLKRAFQVWYGAFQIHFLNQNAQTMALQAYRSVLSDFALIKESEEKDAGCLCAVM